MEIKKKIGSENYEERKIINSLLNVGLDIEDAVKISKEISEYVKSNEKEITSEEIKREIYKHLMKIDKKIAEKYMHYTDEMQMKVRTSLSTFENFDANRITNSLIEETGLDKETSEIIAKNVEKSLKKLNLKFLTAPLIREMVCVELLKNGLEKERKLYTRLGMPVYDVTFLLEHGSKENANLQFNPETIHKLMADQISKEYTLIKVLPLELADAHMRGEIHIHDMDYFFTRPFCFSHDIRFFLKHGLKVDGVGNHTSVAGPAKKPEVAFLHAAKVLAAAQTNYAGGQGFSYFNTFMAPYIRGLEYKHVKQLAQMFIYEMSQMYVARGGQTVFSSIDIDMSVPEQFKDVPAVLPGGIVKESITYSDYEDEVKKLFNAIVDVYMEGDYVGKPFNFPKFEVQVYPKEIDKNEDEFLKVSELAAKFGTPYYIINQPYMPKFACYQCCAFLMPLSESSTEDDIVNGTIRGGALQVVTINLPQIAYKSNGNEEKFYEILRERMESAKNVHLIKREIIKKNQKLGLLPFTTQKVNEKEFYLEVDKQSYVIGLVGMNECVLSMTGYELHENEGWKFGLKVMKRMKEIVADFRKETNLNFSLARTPAESAAYRLAQIDRKMFPDKFIANGKDKDAYYTNSFHVRPDLRIPLFRRLTVEGSFHALTDGGAMSHIWLGEAHPDPEAILQLTKKIALNTAIQYMAFTKDLSVCENCGFVTGGLKDFCPNCGSKNIQWWSRITGYYQNVEGWNRGKIRELMDRRRYEVTGDVLSSLETYTEIERRKGEGRFEELREKLRIDLAFDF